MKFGSDEQRSLEVAAETARRAFDVASDHPPVQHQSWFRQRWTMMQMQQQYQTATPPAPPKDGRQEQQQQQPHPDADRQRRQQQNLQRQM